MRTGTANILEDYILDQNHILGEGAAKVMQELAYRGAVILEVALQTGRMFIARSEYDFVFVDPKCEVPYKLCNFQKPFLEKALGKIFRQNTNLSSARRLLLAGGVQYAGINLSEMTCRLVGAGCGDSLNYDIAERSWIS